jgi:hypothetical protein
MKLKLYFLIGLLGAISLISGSAFADRGHGQIEFKITATGDCAGKFKRFSHSTLLQAIPIAEAEICNISVRAELFSYFYVGSKVQRHRVKVLKDLPLVLTEARDEQVENIVQEKETDLNGRTEFVLKWSRDINVYYVTIPEKYKKKSLYKILKQNGASALVHGVILTDRLPAPGI